MKTTAQRVEDTLRDYETTRSDDKELIARIWYACGFDMTKEQYQKFRTLPSAETIRRERQKFQELGKYPASPKVAKARGQRAMVMEQNMPTASVKRVDDILSGKEGV